MTTQATLKRLLLRRARTIDGVSISTTAAFRVRVTIRPKPLIPFETAAADTHRVLGDEGQAAVVYDVVRDDGTASPAETAELPAAIQMAGLASDQTPTGLLETLVKAVPALGRAAFAADGERTLLVADSDGSSSKALVDRVATVLTAVGYAGLPTKVAQMPPEDRRNDLARSGIRVPRRNAMLSKLAEEDDDTFATRIRRLVNGDSDPVRLLDEHVGARILTTPALQPPLALSCLLPLYDRVFLQMPLWKHSEDSDYFEHHFGTTRDDFLVYCQSGRVVPIFKFSLGLYPPDVVAPWLDSYSLPYLSPRTFDYIALRHIWQSSPHLRLIRADPELAAVLSASLQGTMHKGASTPEGRATHEVLTWLLQGAELFEGLAWHRGHTLLANLSSGGPLAHLIGASPGLFKDQRDADMAAIETFGGVASLACAQAFDASLSEGMVASDAILQLILPFFRDEREAHSPTGTAKLATLVGSLDLSYSARIPAKEYLNVLDAAETRRIREIVHQLLGDGSDKDRTLELRDRVQVLNDQVAKIERRALETGTVDVVGDLAKVGTTVATGVAPASSPATLGLKMAAELLQVPLLKQLGGKAFEALVEDTRAGDVLDKVRGGLNGVSPAAIRLYRLRKKLGR